MFVYWHKAGEEWVRPGNDNRLGKLDEAAGGFPLSSVALHLAGVLEWNIPCLWRSQIFRQTPWKEYDQVTQIFTFLSPATMWVTKDGEPNRP